MPESAISPPAVTKNVASGPSRQYILCRYRIEYRPVASHLIQSEHLTAEYISIYKNCKRHFRQVIFFPCSTVYAEEKGICSTVLSWLVFDVVNMLITAITVIYAGIDYVNTAAINQIQIWNIANSRFLFYRIRKYSFKIFDPLCSTTGSVSEKAKTYVSCAYKSKVLHYSLKSPLISTVIN